ncbi:chromosome partitioning protein [Aliiroseovarius crassostreae]|uniref:Chromosome partitioning protein ParA n=1 Tax=Aliiroseovarius crassostreae TaxID=154981 RepID=A0A0P7KNN8_9RHOB|nr:plasmid partitioning protein RepA [Aliiroseovarius crassostreae]KPN63844.1 chromosome partitioning protein ParA [Aliiroseovarius crassostreae]SFU98248.1 chromosome partitioning protein [Aliiroseovarius crassostreae]
MRLFSATETADLLGVTAAFLRKCHSDGSLPEPDVNKNGRRFYTGQDIRDARAVLEASSRTPGKYLPGRREGDDLQIIQLMNFKGGSAKSTSAIHLCHYLALAGYKTLAIDLDPQGSMTGFFGIQTELEFDGNSIYDAIKYDDPAPMSECIAKTYFPNLDLAPARLILSEFETETAVNAGRGISFFDRLTNAIQSVEADYDVVIIDSPPSLGFLTLAGLYAATAVLVPMTPSMLDLASTQQFLDMTSAYLEVIEGTGLHVDHDFFSFLVTRDDPTDIPSQQIVSLMRALFQDRVLTTTALRSTAIADAAMLKMSIYEVNRSDMTRSTYDRARNSMDGVGNEVSLMIQTAWGRE